MSRLTTQLTVSVAGLRGPGLTGTDAALANRAANAVPFATWAALLTAAPTMGTGDRASVISSDTGTHIDPVTTIAVPNAGIYEKQAAYATPVRIGELASQEAEDVVATIPGVMAPYLAEVETAASGLTVFVNRFRNTAFGTWPFVIFDKLYRIAGGWDATGVLRSAKAVFSRATVTTADLTDVAVSKSFSFLGTSLRTLYAADATWVGGLDKAGRFTARVRKSDGVFQAGQVETRKLTGVVTLNGKPIAQIGGGAALKAPDFAASIEAIIVYGQSLSLGGQGTPAISTVQPGNAIKWADTTYSAFAPLTEPIREYGWESPSTGLATMLQQLIRDENGLTAGSAGHEFQPFLFNPGVGGTAISGLKKGTAPYNSLLAQLTTARNLAAAAGKSFRVRGVYWIQGEQDYTEGTEGPVWRAAVVQLRNDLDADIKALIPDNPDVTMILSQLASHKYYQYQNEQGDGRPAVFAKDALIAQVQLDLAMNEPHFTLATSQYIFEYQTDTVHLLNTSYRLMGGYYGRAYKRVFVDNAAQDIKGIFIKPIDFKVQGKVIEITFGVPRPPLVIDTALTSALAGAGFNLRDASGTDVGALTVSVIEPTKVRIVSPVDVTAGFQLRHAIDGTLQTSGKYTGPRSNLRDSQGLDITMEVNAVQVPLHNPAPIFSHTF